MKFYFLFIVSGAFTFFSCSTQNPKYDADILVYGATSSGIVAAIEAARMGKKVALIEPTQHIGGMTTGGLVWTDYGVVDAVGGLAGEFYARVTQHYQNPGAWKTDDPFKEKILGRSKKYMISFEPHVADSVYRVMMQEAGISVIMGERIKQQDGVVKEGSEIREVHFESGRVMKAKIFIDATYEGDLMAFAKVSYEVGRESKSTYGESLAGVLGDTVLGYRQPKKHFGKNVNPYDANGNLLFGIQDVKLAPPGTGDNKVQAYNVRMCLTSDPANKIPVTRPADYDSTKYELMARYIAAHNISQLKQLFKIDPVPNRKTDINDGCPYSTDYIGANWDYPEGSYSRRQEILEDHHSFTKGMIYFVGNDPRVPENIRQEMQAYGYPKDEYLDNDHWTPQVYIREARRMTGEYVMTQHDCQENTIKEKSIGLGSYGVDSHHIQRLIAPDGELINEGNFLASHHAYEIPLETILPKREECSNLLVPVCVSSSHIAFGSIRMEPVFMILGQSAATLAAMALDEHKTIYDVEYATLAKKLKGDRQVLKLADLP